VILSRRFILVDQRRDQIGSGFIPLYGQVYPGFERQEVDQRQVTQTIQPHSERKEQEQQSEAPFDQVTAIVFRNVGIPIPALFLAVAAEPNHNSQQQQNQVFIEGLPIREFHGIAETAAVRNRVPKGQHEGQQREETHHDQHQPRQSPADETEPEKQAETQQHFSR